MGMSMVCDFILLQKKCGSFRLGDEWWFVQDSEISRKLDDPVVERLSANKALYFFKDF